MNPVEQLRQQGQSVWLDFLRRALITSGELARMVQSGWITGMTSNPTILHKAIAGSNDYDEALQRIAAHKPATPYEAYLELAAEDIRLAADVLRPVYDATDGGDGFVSFEAQEGSTEQIVAEVKRMFSTVGRRNVMIKVPGTPAGIPAVRELIAGGININITLLFGVDVYEQVARAYIAGLEHRLTRGQRVDNVASVASFFVSRVDTKVDAQLAKDSPLRGKIAVANARYAYKRFREIFSGPQWERLAAAGARVQRPLWASTGTKDPAYSDVLYVEELVAADTVNTMPEATLKAFLDHGRVQPFSEREMAQAEEALQQLAQQAIELHTVTEELLSEGLASFGNDFAKLNEEVWKRVQEAGARPARHSGALDALGDRVERRLDAMREQDVMRRVWDGDHTVWQPQDNGIGKRLGWLTIIDPMLEEVARLRAFAESVSVDDCHSLVLLGMGGASLAPEVLWASFGVQPPFADAFVLDTTDPRAIRAAQDRLDLSETQFIASSKSGTTIETMSLLQHFLQLQPSGHQYLSITDAGTPLDRLAAQRGFRRTFLGAPNVGGRYSALSYFGLVPAVLAGIDIDQLLDRAHEMLHACHYCVSIDANPGAWLGATLGEAALAGRDKLTLVLPAEIASLGAWIEQLIAESLGKDGKGIIPVDREPLGPPDVYGADRLFVAIGDHEGLGALEQAGHPVVRLPYGGVSQLGSEFMRWMFATAVAGYVLQVNPFDEPNVREAKDATQRLLAGGAEPLPALPPIAALLEQVRAGDYLALQAFLPRTDALDAELQSLRLKLRDRLNVATTLGYGPRYLHSTGQLHKGGPNNGVFVQLIDEPDGDIPVPGQAYTFGQLNRAQADGDVLSLLGHGRRVTRITLEQLRGAVS